MQRSAQVINLQLELSQSEYTHEIDSQSGKSTLQVS